MKLNDITVTSQSQHTVADFPKCLPAKFEGFFSSQSVKVKLFECADQTLWETERIT